MKKGDTSVNPGLNAAENGVSMKAPGPFSFFFFFWNVQWQLIETTLEKLFKGDNSSKVSNEEFFFPSSTTLTLFEGPKC